MEVCRLDCDLFRLFWPIRAVMLVLITDMVSFLLYVEGSIDGPTEPLQLAQHLGPVSTAPLAVTLINGATGKNFRFAKKIFAGFFQAHSRHVTT